MRKFKYYSFPISYRFFGFLLIILSLYSWYSSFSVHISHKDLPKAIFGPVGFLLIGLIINSTK